MIVVIVAVVSRHALPLFTSLLNVTCAYDPVGYGLPYNHLLFSDYREPLVEVAAQILVVTLDHDQPTVQPASVDPSDENEVSGGGFLNAKLSINLLCIFTSNLSLDFVYLFLGYHHAFSCLNFSHTLDCPVSSDCKVTMRVILAMRLVYFAKNVNEVYPFYHKLDCFCHQSK